MEFESIPFDVTGMLFNINQTYGARAVEKGIRLQIDTADTLPRVLKGDPTRLNQILVNLLGNAIKFTDKGHVGLRIDVVSQTDETIRLRFSVSDTGIGIPKEKQDTVFECFKQAGSDTARMYGGTGLGLSIVKKLVEAQRSEITLVSEQGKGSTFTFDLDFEKTNGSIATEEDTTRFKNLSGVRILLAEDNTVNQLLASDLITGWGATLDIAENGHQAVERLQKETYDLVLMDVQMPVLGGIEATQRIRRQTDARLKNIPIIALTADAVKQNVEKCFDAGMNAHITKPFDATQLNDLIWRHVPEERKNNLDNPVVNTTETPSVLSQEPVAAYRYISLQNLLDFSRGKNDFVVKMLRLLLEQTPPAVQGIGDGIAAANWEDVRALAHKMKPNIHLMGNPELDKLILTLEKDADSRTSVETLPEVYEDFRQLYDRAMEELQAAFNSYSQTGK